MKEMSKTCWESWLRSNLGRRGFTLIEVIAGLALLGTLLASITIARARYVRQRAHAQRRLTAVAVADSLLTGWWQDPQTLPRDGSGNVIEGLQDMQWAWRTRSIDDTVALNAGVQIVRLEIRDGRSKGSVQPVVTVDVAVPAPQQQQESNESSGGDTKDPESGTGQ